MNRELKMAKIKSGTSEYASIHHWLRKNYGRADKCELKSCSKRVPRFAWALKNGCEYERKRKNFMMLCNSCHAIYDETGGWNRGKVMNDKYRAACKASMGKRKIQYSIPINQYDKNWKFIRSFCSVNDALKSLDRLGSGTISMALTGSRRTAFGFKWKYAGLCL